jgi:hypothetical protein
MLDFADSYAQRTQMFPGLLDTGGVEHGSFVVGRKPARAQDEEDFSGVGEFDALLAIVEFSCVRAQAELVGVPGGGSGDIDHRNVITSGWTEEGHGGSGAEYSDK